MHPRRPSKSRNAGHFLCFPHQQPSRAPRTKALQGSTLDHRSRGKSFGRGAKLWRHTWWWVSMAAKKWRSIAIAMSGHDKVTRFNSKLLHVWQQSAAQAVHKLCIWTYYHIAFAFHLLASARSTDSCRPAANKHTVSTQSSVERGRSSRIVAGSCEYCRTWFFLCVHQASHSSYGCGRRTGQHWNGEVETWHRTCAEDWWGDNQCGFHSGNTPPVAPILRRAQF